MIKDMDPAKLQTLDPKLQEAYKRVMATNTVPKSAPPPLPHQQTPVTAPAATPAQAPASTTPMQQPPAQQDQKPPVAPVPAPVQHQTYQHVVIPQSAPANNTQPAPPVQAPPPPPPAPAPTATVKIPTIQEGLAQTNQTTTMPLSSLDATTNNQMHAYVADEVAGAKQSIKTIQLIYVVGGIVFFVVYALFWMKFFNVASPF